jgi:1-phosphatidylinositol-3-phosphate 5-kinase
MVKILGLYRVRIPIKGKIIKQDFVIMENLFYGKNVTKVFDLKGSLRNRYQNSKNAVLLDENLLESFFFFFFN